MAKLSHDVKSGLWTLEDLPLPDGSKVKYALYGKNAMSEILKRYKRLKRIYEKALAESIIEWHAAGLKNRAAAMLSEYQG